MNATEQTPSEQVRPIVPIGWAFVYLVVWILFIGIAPDFLSFQYLVLIFAIYNGLVWQQFLGEYREQTPRLAVGLRFVLSAFSLISLYYTTTPGPR